MATSLFTRFVKQSLQVGIHLAVENPNLPRAKLMAQAYVNAGKQTLAFIQQVEAHPEWVTTKTDQIFRLCLILSGSGLTTEETQAFESIYDGIEKEIIESFPWEEEEDRKALLFGLAKLPVRYGKFAILNLKESVRRASKLFSPFHLAERTVEVDEIYKIYTDSMDNVLKNLNQRLSTQEGGS